MSLTSLYQVLLLALYTTILDVVELYGKGAVEGRWSLPSVSARCLIGRIGDRQTTQKGPSRHLNFEFFRLKLHQLAMPSIMYVVSVYICARASGGVRAHSSDGRVGKGHVVWAVSISARICDQWLPA